MLYIKSLIFKIINGDLKVFNKTIIATSDNLKNLEKTNATLQNKNGVFNLKSLSVSSSESISSFNKLENAFKAYNGNLTKSTHLQNSYINAIGGQNKALGNYLAGLNGTNASMGGYLKSLVSAKLASIGLQAASLALNAAISMGLSLAINALVSGISKWINKKKEARAQAIETAQTAKEEVSNLTELLNKYNQLSEEIKTNTSAKDSLMSTQEELLKALGIEQSELDGLIEKYGDLSTAINQITLDALKDSQADLLTGYNAYKEELINAGSSGFWGGKNIINASGYDAVKAFKELQNAGIINSGSYGTAGGAFVLAGDSSTVDGILENYAKLKSAQEALDQAVENGVFTKEELSENSLYNAITAKEKELRGFVNNYYSAIDDVNENSANQQIISNLMGNEIPKTAEEFDTFKQSLIDTAQASNNFIGTQEDIKDSVINALAEMPEFKHYFEDLADAQAKTPSKIPNPFSLESITTNLTDITKIKTALGDIEKAYKTVSNATKEYAENGFYSIETINSIISLEDEYANTLIDENGQLDLSSDKLNQLSLMKLESAKASVYLEAAEELTRIKQLDTTLATQELAYANGTLTESAYNATKALYDEVVAMGGVKAEMANQVWNAANAKVSFLDNESENIKNNIHDLKKSLSESSSSDSLKDTFTKEYNLLKHNLEMGYITQKEYYDSLEALNNKCYGGKANSLEEYQKYEEEIYKGLKAYYKDYLDSTISALDAQLDAGVIDYKHYSSTVNALLDSLYADGKISATDYHSYVQKTLEKQLSIYDKILSAIARRFDKEIDYCNASIASIEKQNDALSSQKTLMDEASQALISHYQKLINAQKETLDNLDAESNKLNEELSNYDKVLSAVNRVYDNEIKGLTDQQDLLQEKIDAINSEADAYDLVRRKEEALYALEQAQDQRTKKVFVEGQGFKYTTDDSAIKNAQNTLKDIKNEELIKSIQGEKDALQESINVLEEYKNKWNEVSSVWSKLEEDRLAMEMYGENFSTTILQNRVADIEDFKGKYISTNQQINDNTELANSINEKIAAYELEMSAWESLSSCIQNNVNAQAADQLFGAGWEAQINEGRLISFEEFKENYIAIDAQMNDNAKLIESYNEKIAYYNDLKKQWSDISSAYAESVEDQLAALHFGDDWETKILSGRLDILSDFKNEYFSIQDAIVNKAWESANAQIEAAKQAQKGAQGNLGSANTSNGDSSSDKKEPQPQSKNYRVVQDRVGQTVGVASFYTEAEAKDYAKNLNRFIAEGDPEYYIKFYVDAKKYHSGLANGMVDENTFASDFKLVQKYGLKQGEVPAILKQGEGVINNDQTHNLAEALKLVPYASIFGNFNTPNYSHFDKLSTASSPTQFCVGNIHIHDVQNVDGLANAIVREFPNKMLQALNKRY